MFAAKELAVLSNGAPCIRAYRTNRNRMGCDLCRKRELLAGPTS